MTASAVGIGSKLRKSILGPATQSPANTLTHVLSLVQVD